VLGIFGFLRDSLCRQRTVIDDSHGNVLRGDDTDV
jgi:hypothetical protein